MTAAYFGEGGYGAPASVIHADSAHPNHIVVPDAQLLFAAHFHRAGPDLVLTGRDGHNHIVPGYFSSEHRPALAAPNGAMLSPHLVDLLAGSAAPNEYAQTGPITPPEPIGRVEKVVGDVTVVRNGTAVTLNVGDAVYKSDVVQTSAGSSAGIAFPDGSALNLVANTRMALSEYSYDPNSTSNSALFNLVEGGLSFVAGKVAHTGDMKIGTPVATMGIRGTAGWLYEDTVANVTANAGNVTLHFAAVFDSVTNTESTYTLYAVDANGELQHDAQGNLISLATVSSTQNGLVTSLTGNGINALPSVTTGPPDITQQQFANLVVPQVINMAIQAIQQYQQQQQQNQPTNPQSNPSSPGSSTPPANNNNNGPQDQQHTFNLNNGGPTATITVVTDNTGPTNSGPTTPSNTQPTTPTTTPTNTGNPTWTGGSTGSFNDPTQWSGPAPGPQNSPIIDTPTPSHPTVNQDTTVAGLTIGPGDSVQVQGDPILTITGSGQVTVEASGGTVGEIEATGIGAQVIISDQSVDDQGTIFAGNGGTIVIGSPVTVDAGGTVEASGAGAAVTFDDGASIAAGAEVESSGSGATVNFFSAGTVDDSGTILAASNGAVQFGVSVTVEAGGVVEASGSGSSITINDGVTVVAGGAVEADGEGASVFITNVGGTHQVFNAGVIEADNDGAVTFFDVQVENAGGTIEALGADSMDLSTVSLSGSDIVGGTLETGSTTSADDGEILVGAGLESTFFDGSTGEGAVTIDAFVQVDDGSSLELLGTIHNEGTLAVGAISGADLVIGGTVTLDGSGMIALDGDASAIVEGDTTGDTLFNNGSTISGSGAIGEVGGSLTLVNDGTIEAGTYEAGEIEASGQIVVNALDVQNESDGLFLAANGSTISFDGSSIENYGTIEAFNGGTVSIGVGALTNEAGGTIEGIDFTVISIDDGLNNAGEVSAAGGSRFSIAGDVSNTATIETVGGAITFTGGDVTNADGATISGAVTFDSADVTNEAGATIILDGSLAVADVLKAGLSGDTVHNAGAISIISDVPFDSTTIDNSGGTISLASESDLDLSGSTIGGGTVTDDGNIEVLSSSAINNGAVVQGDAGTLTVDSGATLTLDDATLENLYVTNNGTLQIDSGHTLTLTNTTIDGGAINDDGALNVDDSTISGSTITMGSQGLSFTTLDDPSVTSFVGAAFALINNAGQVLGIEHSQAFLYGNGIYADLNDPSDIPGASFAGINNGVSDINNSGEVVGYYTGTEGIVHGFVYSDGTYNTLDDPYAGFDGTIPEAVNNAGQIAGYYFDNDNLAHGFVYSDGTFTTLDDPEAANGTFVQAINDFGLVAGNYSADDINHGFIYANGSYTTLDDPLGVNGTYVVSMNNAGAVVGYYYDADHVSHGFIYSGGAYTTLTDPSNALGTVAQGINDEGEVAGYYIAADGSEHGFIYSGGAYTNIDAPFAQTYQTNFQSINDSGQIAGFYYNYNTGVHIFTADPTTSMVLGDGSTISGGTLSIAAADVVEIESGEDGSGATLDGESVSNLGVIEIDNSATLSLDNATITGGAILDNGLLDVTGSSTLIGDANIIGGNVTVESEQTFTLGDNITLDDTIFANNGTVALGGEESSADLTIANQLTLDGSGVVGLENSADVISGATGADTLVNSGNTIVGSGTIEDLAITNENGGAIGAEHSDTLTIQDVAITNESGASLYTTSHGTLTIEDAGLTNADGGTISASDSSTINIESAIVTNAAGGIVEADDSGTVAFSDGSIDNSGGVTAQDSGTVSFENYAVTNEDGATIEALDSGSIVFLDTGITNDGGATIESDGAAAAINFTDDSVTNAGTISADGSASFTDTTVANAGGTISVVSGATLYLSGATIDGGTITDDGATEVGGTSTIDSGAVVQGDSKGSLTVDSGAILTLDDATLDNVNVTDNGALQVDAGHTLTLSGSAISGGTIDLGQGSEQVQSVSEISVAGLSSYAPVVSGNGGVVAFEASDSLPGSDNDGGSIELYNAASGQVANISALAEQHPGETFNNIPSISSDGNDVVFTGDYQFTNDSGTFQTSDILLYNAQTQQVTVAYSNASHGVISGNGQFIAAEANSPFDGTPHGQSVVVTDQSGDLLTQITGDPSYVLPQDGSDHFGNVGSAYDPAISGNGRYVTFWSTSSDIAVTQGNATSIFSTGNTTGNAEVYLYDRQSNTLQEVSGVIGGLQGNADSGTLSLSDNNDNDWASALSANGRYVVFQSDASNLVAGTGDQNGVSNIFLYDSWTHTTQLVSVGVGGTPADGASYRPAISADGTYVSFSSTATDLVAGGTDGTAETYVYDTQTGTLQLASAAADGTPANAESDLASTLSTNGAVVAYGGTADNLGPDANSGFANVFVDNLNQTPSGVLDITADTTISGGTTITGGTVTVEAGATLTLDGATIDGSTIDLAQGTETTQSVSEISAPPFFAIGPAVSADGNYVAFIASTSLPGQGNGNVGGDIDLYNVATGHTTDISALVLQTDLHDGETFGNIPSISADGRYVVFEGDYPVTNTDTENGPQAYTTSDVFLYDSQGEPGFQVTLLQQNAGQPEISGNGQFIVASSFNNQNYGDDILVMDHSGSVLTEITGNPNYVPPDNQTDSFGNGGSVEDPAISSDGRYVSFWSTSSEIVAGETTFQTGDTNGVAQVYVYDTQNNTLQMVSVNNHGQQGNGDSGATSLNADNNNNNDDNDWVSSFSADGRFVVFQSAATNLAPGGGTPAGDSNIYLYDLQTHTIALVSAAADGSPALGDSIRPEISPDGQYVTFASDASNLPGANGAPQTYIVAINPVTGTVASGPELVSTGFAGADNGQNELGNAVSNNGAVAFGGAAFALNASQDLLVGNGQAQLLSAAAGTVHFSDLTITDYNAGDSTLTVTLSVEHGTLAAFAPTSGVTIVGDNDGSHGTLEFSGSLDAINAAMQSGVIYTPTDYNPDSPWSDVLTATLEDGQGNTATATGSFDPQAPEIFTGETNSGQYDIFLTNESTAPQGAVDVTDDTTVSNTTVNGGTVTVESGVTLTLDNVVLNSVDLAVDGGDAPSIQIDAGDTLTWAGTSAFTGPGSVVIDNDGHIIHAGMLDIGFSQMTFEGSGTVTENGGNHGLVAETLINDGNTFDGYGQMGNNAGGVTIVNNEGGTFDGDVAGNALVLDTGNTITNAGTFEATGGGTLRIVNSTLDNEGSIVADGGTVVVGGSVTGGGSATIENNGTLELGSTDAQTVTFNDASTLRLDHQDQGDALAYAGTIDGFGSGDQLNLTGFGTQSSDQFSTSASYDSDTNTTQLTITDVTQGGETSAPITLSGDYTNSNNIGWTAVSDGNGGVNVTEVALPVVSVNPSTAVTTNQNAAVTLDSLSVSDPNANDTIVVSLDVAHGALTLGSISDLTGDTGLGTGAVTLTGTVSEIDAALASGVTYAPNTDFAGPDNLVVDASDGTLVGNPETLVINVVPPTISFANGTINYNNLTPAPVIGDAGSALQLTDGGLSEAASWFATDKVAVGSFTASFDYQATPQGGGLGDGMAFILQDDPNGSSALGGNGSSLGYGPAQGNGGGAAISPSAAIELNLYDAGGTHIPGTNFATDGSYGSYISTGTVDFADTGDQIQVVLNYDGSALTETLTDLGDGHTFSTTYDNVNLAQILGADTAYVGFSAATGGAISTQTVSNFTFTSVSEPPPPVVSFNPTYFSFDGNSYMSGPVATTQVGNGSNDGVTLAGWVDWNGESNAANKGQVLFYNGSTSDAGSGIFGVVTEGGLDLQILVGGNTVIDTGVTLSADQWHNVALTHVDGNFTLYVDGVADSTASAGANGIPNPSYSDPDLMQIGGDSGGEDFAGSIADLSVWNTALSQSQIQTLQSTYLSGNESSLAGYYPLSDGGGATAADSVNNAGNLTLSGNPTWVVDGSQSWPITGGDTPENSSATLIGLNVSETNTADTLTVTLDAGNGTLSIGSASSVSETGVGTDALSLSGTAAAIDAALTSGVTYTPNTGFTGTDDLAFNASDGAVAGTPETLAINVEPEGPPPPPPVDTWNDNDSSFQWSDTANWSDGNSSPGAGLQAAIATGGNPQITSSVTLDGVALQNGGTDGASIDVASGAILTLLDNTVISNGTLSIDSQSEVDVEVGSAGSGSGATFDALNVTNGLVIEVGITTSGALLTLDDNAIISGNTLNIGTAESGGSTVDVETGQFGSGATLDGVTVNNYGHLDVGDIGSQASLVLDDGAAVHGGAMTIDDTLDIEAGGNGPGATLDGVDVAVSGNIEVATTTGLSAILTLENGTTISGNGTGTLTIGPAGEVEVAMGASDSPSATFDDVNVQLQSADSSGTIQVDGTAQPADLVLTDGTTVTGGTLSIGSSGQVEIQSGDNGSATFDNVTVDNSGTLQIDDAATLMVADTVTLQGGGTVSMMAGSQIAEEFTPSGLVMSLDNVDNMIEGAGTIGDGSGDLALTNEAAGVIDANGGTIALDTGSTDTNAGLMEATNGGTLNIDDDLENSGTVLADGGTVVVSFGASPGLGGAGSVTIAGGGVVDLVGDAFQNITFAGPGTLEAASNHGTITGFGTGDVYDLLDDVPYTAGQTTVWTQTTTGSNAGGTLQIFKNGGDTLEATLHLAGTYTTADFALAPDSSGANAGTEVVFNSPDYWGSFNFPAQPTPEAHLQGGDVQVDGLAGVIAVLYSSVPDYSPAGDPTGPYAVSRDVLPLDPFLLPILEGAQTVVPATLLSLPAKSKVILPNISSGDSISPEGIGIDVTQVDGSSVIDQIVVTPNDDAPLTVGSPTTIESGTDTASTIYNLDLSFRNDNSTATTNIPYLSTYALAWDQYNSGTYTIDFQIFNPDGSASSPVETPEAFTRFNGESISATPGTNGATNLPAWEFRSGGGIYALAIAQYNSGVNQDRIEFLGYNLNGTLNTTNGADLETFTISPNLSFYSANDPTNAITQDVIPSLSPFPGAPSEQLEFAQVSANNDNDWVIGWNETVTNAGTGAFLGDQVEFVIDRPNTGLISISLLGGGSTNHFTAQLTDAQNVHVATYTDATGHDFVVLAYGDATATHLVDFEISSNGNSATEIASITDPTTQTYTDVASLGNGLFAVEYDNVVGPGETSQFDYKIFDFATTGLDNPTLSITEANYIAGTQFLDVVTGADGVNNLYYFVGLATTNGVGPADSFAGGSDGWNIAIFADARSDYTIATHIENNGPNVTTITSDGADPEHTGSLAVTNVEFLAFDPSADPTPHNGTIDVNGGTFVILGGNSPITIEAGATAEIDSSASGSTSYAGSVTFEAAIGTLAVDQLNEFTGTISGITGSSDVLDLGGFGAHKGDAFEITPVYDSGTGDTTLTVTDTSLSSLSNEPSESVALVGNYTSANGVNWGAVSDGNGGIDVFDPSTTNSATSVLSTATADGASGSVAFDANSGDTFSASFTPEGADYVGNFSLSAVTETNSTASVEFDFNSDQINLAPGETLTQSYNVTLADAQNPAASQTQTVAVTIGGPGNDNFVFAPGIGADTITNFNPQQDTIELNHFADAQTVQELQSLITTDAHGDAIINLGHNDSITLANTTTAQLQQAIQAGHVLLH